jgi:hypothetical protein
LGQSATEVRSGRISGHIYRADKGAALPDVVVTAQQSSGSHWSTRSARDGSYSIAGLSEGSYWVGAYREGFVGSFYGDLNGPGTKILPGGAATGIDVRLNVQPRLTPIPDKAFVAAYGKKREALLFYGGRFSPDGTLLALIVGGINIGGPEQTWLYNLRSQQMTAVSEAPRADRSPTIEHYAWDEDGTFYVVTDRSIIAATETTRRELASLPNNVAEAFKFQDALQSTVPPAADVVHQNGRFTVFSENFGHGNIHLRLVDGASDPVDIARGSGELETFILDVRRSRVLYPSLFGPAMIFTFDLNARTERGFPLQTGVDIRLLDENRSGTLVAYSVAGSCEPDESLKEGILLRFKPIPQKPSPRHACLVTAP